jgi:hypothetical protein
LALLSYVGGATQTDTKHTWFCTDSTITDNKLVSCYELNCCNIRARPQSTSASTSGHAKRACPLPPSEDDVGHDYDNCRSVITDDTSIAEIAHGVGKLGQKCKGKAKAPPSEDDVGHDYNNCRSVITDDTSIAEIAHGVGKLGQKCKGKGKAKANTNTNTNSKGKAHAKP